MFVDQKVCMPLKPDNLKDLKLFLDAKWAKFREENKNLIKELGTDESFYPGSWGEKLDLKKTDPNSVVSS